jgi:hypothetical protein
MREPWPLHAQEQIASFNGKFAEPDVPEDETAAEGESRTEQVENFGSAPAPFMQHDDALDT